ncbi:MAG TPA: cytochrome c maturation protein CcmE [Acidimicrobiales bacterium]|nr:cytochrome c maturation protein CcmE [Acidimicrobiales bacterium]
MKRTTVAIAVIVLALGFLVFRGLGNATVYFKTVDEAVAQKPQLADERFRIEGTVVDEPKDGRFTIKGTQHSAAIVHTGDIPQLMQVGIPVVLEGRWKADHFASDRVMVKHTSEYREKNPDRVEDYSPPQ